MDTSLLMCPKPEPRVIRKRQIRLDGEAAERECRAEVWRRYGRKCNVPGCREWAT